MSIELAGIPGGGKTTVANRLENEAGYRVVRISSKGELVWKNIVALVQYPIWVLMLFFHVVANSSSFSTFWYKLTNLFLIPNAKYIKAKAIEQSIIDQGYLQSLISISEKPLADTIMHRLLLRMPKTKGVFLFDPSSETVALRTQGREYIVKKREGDAAFQARLAVMRKNAECIQREGGVLLPDFHIILVDRKKQDVYAHVANMLP